MRRSAAFALESLKGQEGGNNALFQEYNAAGNARWNTGWPGQIDLTGVAWNSPRTATAVTPRHVVMAAHFPRKIGDTLVFHDRSGKRHTRVLVKTVSLRGAPTRIDIMVGLLDHPLPDLIKAYPLLEPAADYADRLAGGPVLVTDSKRQLAIHEIMYVNRKALRFAYNPDYADSMRTMLIRGDSGNPSFLILDGELVLVETHTMGGPGTGPFYSTPVHFKGLEQAVQSLDPAYKLKVVKLNDRYVREAAASRADRKAYVQRNTDGSQRKPPADKRTRPTNTRTVSPARPATSPGTGNGPRPRRVPTPKTP